MSKESVERSGPDKILIVGDWVVDEYWFLVSHHSRISSHTGFTHYRVLTDDHGTSVSGLCGAGHIARVMHRLRARGDFPFDLVGLGSWTHDDTDLIGHLVHAHDAGEPCRAAIGGCRLNPRACGADPGIQLIPLEPDGPTIRVIRLYHGQGEGIAQLGRIDWEPISEEVRPRARPRLPERAALPRRSEVRSIVVNDLGKGVISEELVKDLRKRYPSAAWYVRTKKLEAPWLDRLGESIRLRVVGPEVAALFRPWGEWLPRGSLTLEAKNVMVTLKGKNIAVLSDQHEVIALLEDAGTYVTGRATKLPSLLSQLGWPTAFFAALIVKMHSDGDTLSPKAIRAALQEADELAGIDPPAGVSIPAETRELTVSHGESWEQELRNWDAAWSDYGTIRRSGDREVLQVWRAMGQLSGYVACIRQKREIIDEIGTSLRRFRRTAEPPHALSILFHADPGAGKTFLAERLAKELDFDLIPYDVTQMLRREDLLDLFETVATAQTTQTRRPLVFVDEINAGLEGQEVYGAFLAPLEQGVYARHGRKFSVKPCVWMFAGTKKPTVPAIGPGDKFSDFRSRMTLIKGLDYGSLEEIAHEQGGKKAVEEFDREARLEQVYLGAMMIRREYPDVREIGKQILRYFHEKIDPARSPARELRRLAQTLEDVQYGRVTISNCGAWGFRDWWEREDGDPLVVLEF